MSPSRLDAYLVERGWIPTGKTTQRQVSTHRHVSVTWWRRGGYEYPQFLALDLEKLGWTKMLDAPQRGE